MSAGPAATSGGGGGAVGIAGVSVTGSSMKTQTLSPLPPTEQDYVRLQFEQLSAHAPVLPVDHNLSLARYVGSAKQLLSQARFYRRVGELRRSFLLFLRFSSLLIDTLPKHKEYAASATSLKPLIKECVEALQEGAALKAELRTQFCEEYRIRSAQRAAEQAREVTRPESEAAATGATDGAPASADAALASATAALQSVALASSAAPATAAAAPVTVPSVVDYLRSGPVRTTQPDLYPADVSTLPPRDVYASAVCSHASACAYGSALHRFDGGGHSAIPTPPPSTLPLPPISVPIAPAAGTAPPAAARAPTYSPPTAVRAPALASPSPGVLPRAASADVAALAAAGRSYRAPVLVQAAAPDVAPAVAPAAAPGVAPVPMGSAQGLRPLVLFREMLLDFLKVARPNTARGIETCGVLAGTIVRDTLFVTTLIIPKQEGSADMCSTLNEEELFLYQDKHNLLTLGWIHTHPTQDCFMSSVDLHTHCGYQSMLAEAVAVVMAPARGVHGVFSLHTPDGLQLIQRCPRSGFHAHDAAFPLYVAAAHVSVVSGPTNYRVVDLR